jgi:hypothetical protein
LPDINAQAKLAKQASKPYKAKKKGVRRRRTTLKLSKKMEEQEESKMTDYTSVVSSNGTSSETVDSGMLKSQFATTMTNEEKLTAKQIKQKQRKEFLVRPSNNLVTTITSIFR